MARTPELTIGVVGCGEWGRHIVRDLVTLGCRPVVVARSAASRQRASEHGAALVVDSLERLPEVAGVVIATPTVEHARTILAVADRGVPIFVEKPLTATLAEAEAVVAAVGERLFVMHKWAWHPGIEALAELAAGDELGEVHGVRVLFGQWGNPHADVDVVTTLLPHCLSIALAILGELPPPRAARGERLRDATGLWSLRGWLGERPWADVECSSRWPGHRREIAVHGAAGVAVLDDPYADHLRLYRGAEGTGRTPPEPERRPISTELPLLRELRDFVEHLRDGPPPRCSATDGLIVVRAMARLRELANRP